MASIFVSGAAQGLGRAVAHHFLAKNWIVGAYDIVPIADAHPNLHTGCLDVTQAVSWEKALAQFSEHTGGRLDVLHNNAGIIADGNLATLSEKQVAQQLNVNCLGVTLGARAAHPYLAATPGAHLVNMASASAIHGQPGIAVYSATKFYVAGLTEALALEWRGDDIRVIDIWPLWAKTSLAEVRAASVRRLGVHITPEQVAATVWEAVHPKNRWSRGKIHYGVSTLDKLMHSAREALPARLATQLTRIIAG